MSTEPVDFNIFQLSFYYIFCIDFTGLSGLWRLTGWARHWEIIDAKVHTFHCHRHRAASISCLAVCLDINTAR